MSRPVRLLLTAVLLMTLTGCASFIERTPDRTPWGGYAREAGRILDAGQARDGR